MPEPASPEDLVEAYNSVFSVKGGAPVAKYGRQVEYAEDLLRRVSEVDAPAFDPLDLERIRALPKGQLLRLLFKAVAGHFVAGPGSLRGDVCRIQADPISGALDLYRDDCNSEVALTVVALVLLCVLSVMIYRREAARSAAAEKEREKP